MLRCSDNSLYTGITKNLARRLLEHNDKTSGSGAKFTRARQPVTLAYQEDANCRSSASKREYYIKSLTRKQKLALISGENS